MADFYLYVWTFWGHWWPALPTSAFLGLGEFAALYWPPAKGRLEMIPTHIRRGVEVAILLSITFYAGFAAWHEEHTMRVMAEKSAFSRTTHLPRTLAYDNIAPILSFQSNRVLLQGYGLSIINVGQDTIYLQVKEMNFYLYGIKVTGMLASPWAYVPPNRGLSFNGTLSGVFPIASGTSHVEMDVLVVYDTVPSTGLRTSYRKVESDLNWVDGNYSSSGAVKTIEQTEN